MRINRIAIVCNVIQRALIGLHRRHLSASQRACVATDFLELLESAAKQRQIEAVQRGNVSRHDDSPVVANLPELARKDRTKESAEQAAAMLSVSGRSVRDANTHTRRSASCPHLPLHAPPTPVYGPCGAVYGGGG